jgi:hypothetical protein
MQFFLRIARYFVGKIVEIGDFVRTHALKVVDGRRPQL